MYEEKQPVYHIETLIRQYGNDVLRTAFMYVKDSHLAEDIFQDVFIKVNKNLSTFQGNSSIKTWIIRITINTCKDYLKSAWNQKVVPMTEYEENTIHTDDDYKAVEQQDQNQLIRETVMNLPDKYKDIIVCVYYQDMTISDAASILKIAEGTAKSRLSRAKEKLKTCLEGRL
ncbi:sigma-70 family RNA polymerase sigma factor [Anaerocolumna aminovalerica]|jgi:RNA polymerase sigma-70 factor (ECF subfamily)|uniref:RNA polymerase sigma-70 factor, ECF subfamily n=1 Tax=Anaerocolumna aminovalerica TaxID=1527 RepID=A0A1I5DKS8_9FIRM|nr:sigma-70 family RNA polymerase sigma factor [Anaerocolumna aminovalerica]MBU5332210.1 sigma-70 family RNA polymerase sigma factor [Anaerocolumna aminovalerica]MDU6263914.1 sigma-70 family RNA polymerase sigma factor [Anaerocolumna aminovalerica]SFN99760.1 RNA polymerase sigma-70 factor, ECF subfamily [Anaerocolumna aminovalerica]